jgi:hypothetical protein
VAAVRYMPCARGHDARDTRQATWTMVGLAAPGRPVPTAVTLSPLVPGTG